MARKELPLWKQIWQKWWQETIALLLVLVGLFLLLERFSLRAALLDCLQALGTSMAAVGGAILDFASRFASPSNLLAMVAISIALTIAFRRLRYRLLQMPHLARLRCPKCEGSIYKKHRHWEDRLINLVVPVRRYACKHCSWEGQRVYDSQGWQRQSARSTRSRKGKQQETADPRSFDDF
ncbi:hypothetical protein KR51_00002390 [Rubidibacter lacunae KORDI 51-2]|uniref:Uncharacterized protein n=1 Tax=Rubidibacter lacunae KORDI 51-2 TaxID=582515 RepID=U5DTC7_9CHRO|nr:hypothetical protein [Rubidibacter lacunae]ERN42935.1 hypothetical protein KR51_00002390 [Rubidibacter lacunae KORDI 51-2]